MLLFWYMPYLSHGTPLSQMSALFCFVLFCFLLAVFRIWSVFLFTSSYDADDTITTAEFAIIAHTCWNRCQWHNMIKYIGRSCSFTVQDTDWGLHYVGIRIHKNVVIICIFAFEKKHISVCPRQVIAATPVAIQQVMNWK